MKDREVRFKISGKAWEKVTSLKVRTNAETYTEVLRDALTWYSTLVDLVDSDGNITIQTDQEIMTFKFKEDS